MAQAWDLKLLFRSWCPYDWVDKRTVNKSSQRALCCTYATSSRLHFSYLFDPVWSSYSCPLVHALCKKKLRLLSLFFPHYLSPTPFLPAPPHIFLSLTSPSPPFNLFPLSLFSGPSPCCHPFRPVWTGVCVWIFPRSVFFVDWLPARTVKALPAARTWKMHRISLW